MPDAVRVLVVEDNTELRVDLKDVLRLEGYSVSVTADGVEALAFLKRNRVDLVVSDSEMPQMDGISLLRSLRSDKDTANLPFILMSANAPLAVEDDPKYHFLRKPIAISELTGIITQMVSREPAGISIPPPV